MCDVTAVLIGSDIMLPPTGEILFLTMLLFLLWDSALLYWDIPEANFSIGLKWHIFV